MLRKIISLSISLIIIVTGLILTNLSLPFLSNYLGYDLHGNGLMGITFATMAWLSIGTVYYKMAVQLR